MKIELKGVGKRFRQEWVLRELSGSFEQPGRYAVTGPNGSGKSTLLRLLSGHLTPSKGQVSFFENEQKLNPEQVYAHISYAAPYIELIEEFTLAEALDFHRKFRPFLPGLGTKELIARLGFQKSATKEIRHFSSGMKQRLKLLLGQVAGKHAQPGLQIALWRDAPPIGCLQKKERAGKHALRNSAAAR